MQHDTFRRRSLVAAGAFWILLAMLAAPQVADKVSYDWFNRALTVPLIVSAVAWFNLRPVPWRHSAGARVLWGTAASAWILLIAGNAIEFWGVLLQDEPNAFAAHEAGTSSHWIGSDIGWMAFMPGVLVLSVASLVLAAITKGAVARTLTLLFAVAGAGLLTGNLVGPGPLFAVYAAYGAAWILAAKNVSITDHLPSSATDRTGNPAIAVDAEEHER